MKVLEDDGRTDEKLIQELGIDKAFSIIFSRRVNEIYAYCKRYLSFQKHCDPELIAYEIFEQAWKSRHTYKGFYIAKTGKKKEAKFKNWLYSIAHHRCYEEIKKTHPVFISLEYINLFKYHKASISMRLILNEFKKFLNHKLPHRQKTKLLIYYKIFYLKFVTGYNYREIALRYNLNQNTVRYIGVQLKNYYREFWLI